ncbi:trypco2 family protein [Streptomyces sp. NPDC059070]|uniref:trypco2 family protein n=1 Tax=unclassified Streptomyces TaxID=2593676 RepID=UPI0034E2D0C7
MGNADTGADDALDLADAITLLRDQVAEAQRRIGADAAGDFGVRFALGEITLELGLELTRTRGRDGALRFGAVSLGGKRENARKATHTLTVRLTPHLPDGGDVDVSDEDDA